MRRSGILFAYSPAKPAKRRNAIDRFAARRLTKAHIFVNPQPSLPAHCRAQGGRSQKSERGGRICPKICIQTAGGRACGHRPIAEGGCFAEASAVAASAGRQTPQYAFAACLFAVCLRQTQIRQASRAIASGQYARPARLCSRPEGGCEHTPRFFIEFAARSKIRRTRV